MSTETDNIPEVIEIYGFDPITFRYVYTSIAEVDNLDNLENFTLIAVPEYDAMVQDATFDVSSQLWQVDMGEHNFNELKLFARARIDRLASIKIKNITSAVAQNSDLYNLKYLESVKYIADGEPTDLTNYPFLSAGTEASGTGAAEYAEMVISKHTEYINALVEIEKARLLDNNAIDFLLFDMSKTPEVVQAEINSIINDPTSLRLP